ncbi:MAG: DUF2293 domain-containing protein [Flavobacteriales bacterium]|nr:DUF2293 domain-containing protein [Flavobacteriales bacterium]
MTRIIFMLRFNQTLDVNNMETFTQNIYLTKKEKLRCNVCRNPVRLGQAFVAEQEHHVGTCMACSPFSGATFLPPGDAALTRRSKKHSSYCGVLYGWNRRRKRFERKGQYVEAKAIELARKECFEDKQKRAVKNEKAAVVRAEQDIIYIAQFAEAIRKRYPNCPKNREVLIAQHACEKYSGRVGRTANAKQFDGEMIDLAVEAHIRHKETNYDNQFNSGKTKRVIRANVKQDITVILKKWS